MKYILSSIAILFPFIVIYSQQYNISGYVEDIQSGEKLIGASIIIGNSTKGAITNNYGFYSLNCKENQVELLVSYIGYKQINQPIILKKDTILNFNLENTVEELEGVVVSAKSVNRNNSGVLSLTSKQIAQIPSLSGEKDVLKAFQLLPGVQFGNEGNSSLLVRGGSPDQNLILLDEVPMYYINHIGGFISVFDEYSINSINLFKSGIPARYGGRLSSVIDVRMKDGNLKTYHGQVSLGVLTSKVSLEGPLIKEKSSFFISLRRSNIDLFTRAFSQLQYKGKEVFGYTLYDLNAKLNYRISEKDRLYLSVYNGKDRLFINIDNKNDDVIIDPEYRFTYKSDWENSWGNSIIAFRWNHLFNKKMFGNTLFAYSKFKYNDLFNYEKTMLQSGLTTNKTVNNFTSGINDLIGKIDIDYHPNINHTLRFGVRAIIHNFIPCNSEIKKTIDFMDIADTSMVNMVRSNELAYYIEDKFVIHNLIGNIGFHSMIYSTRESVFFAFEPRINLTWKVNDFISLNTSYSRMTQPVHLISNSGTGFPTDLWVPATKINKPEIADHYSLGFESNLSNDNYTFTIDGFYKNIKNLIDISEGTTFFANTTSWENHLENKGLSDIFGIELLLKKNYGKINGWIAYTLMKNQRKFERINQGEYFPYKYDRRHDLTIYFNYKVSEKINISANWVYLSGSPVTLGTAKMPALDFKHQTESANEFATGFYEAYIYGSKNNYRMPAYHRMDIGINFYKKKKHGTRTISLNFYNVYNRKNPYFLFYEKDDKTNQTNLYKMSIFPIIPSISYSYVF